MSDAPVAIPEQPAAPVAPAVEALPACPITADFLPPNMRKHVDVKAPASLRLMAAKGLVPLPPSDMLSVLFMLSFDPDPGVRETTAKTSADLPDRILASALRDENVSPHTLAFFLRLLWQKDAYAELLILNSATPDTAVAEVADRCNLRTAEIIGQNQLRVLRHEDIVRKLCSNPNVTAALIDSVCDFGVRSGLILEDVPQMKEARVRLFGPEAAENPPEQGPTAAEVLQDLQLAVEDANPMEEKKRSTLTQRIMRMSVAEKVKLASLGNRETRGILLRDANRVVSMAAITNPRITDGEVEMIANNRACNEDVLRVIYNNREWTKRYPVKKALVKNPKTPMSIALRYLSTLRESEVKEIARDKNVPSGIQTHAKKMMDKKNAPQKK
jgi:hypothetical protein